MRNINPNSGRGIWNGIFNRGLEILLLGALGAFVVSGIGCDRKVAKNYVVARKNIYLGNPGDYFKDTGNVVFTYVDGERVGLERGNEPLRVKLLSTGNVSSIDLSINTEIYRSRLELDDDGTKWAVFLKKNGEPFLMKDLGKGNRKYIRVEGIVSDKVSSSGRWLTYGR